MLQIKMTLLIIRPTKHLQVVQDVEFCMATDHFKYVHQLINLQVQIAGQSHFESTYKTVYYRLQHLHLK